ncbi:MAG: hypothetical protein IID51_06000 [Proteobacteria bacterium]|nr:hypothetical protein [Pseudomonadota bacterium]
MDHFDDLSGHLYLYLANISEPKDNALILVIEEARADGPEIDDELPEGSPVKAREIETTAGCSKYKVYFENYIAYAVVDESYAQSGKDEIYEGGLARIYRKSYFLDFVSKTTFASSDYPGPFKHYAFICLNHCINVVSCNAPKIKHSVIDETTADGINSER